MSLKTLLGAVTVASAGLFLTAIDDAQASQWGCEVLLCASSSNPSWRGVPACHPPMHRLISAMRGWGFSWPTCPEAGTGKPGYEQYEECPAGWSVGYTEFGMGGRSEPDVCTQTTNTCGSRFGGRDGCTQTVALAFMGWSEQNRLAGIEVAAPMLSKNEIAAAVAANPSLCASSRLDIPAADEAQAAFTRPKAKRFQM